MAGERYARKDELERGRRHGTNPGTVGLAGQRVPIRVPRVRSQEGVEIPLRSYEALNDGGEVNDLLLKRVLYGISCRNYEAAAEAIPGAIGLSSSTVSRDMIELLSNPLVDFVSRVALPGLSVLVAILTLAVLLFTLRRVSLTLTRSVTPQIECYLRVRQSGQVFDFVIANFGLGSAYRVSFSLDADEEDFAAHNVGCYVSSIGKPHEYFDLTVRRHKPVSLAGASPA